MFREDVFDELQLQHSSNYRRLSQVYERLHSDERIHTRTSFFRAAAVVTELIGWCKPLRAWGRLSCQLEELNIERGERIRLGQLYRLGSIEANTADFIHFEQTCVQSWLDGLFLTDRARYRELMAKSNRLLREPSVQIATSILQPCFAAAVLAVQTAVGGYVDVAKQSHREALGCRIAAVCADTKQTTSSRIWLLTRHLGKIGNGLNDFKGRAESR